MVLGLSHITLMVGDLNRSAELFEKVFDAKEVYDSKEETFSLAREKFLMINGLWICLMEGPSLEEPTYNHIAFQIEEKDLEFYSRKLKDSGIKIENGRPRIQGEGQSIYFYDYDNHLFELHAGTLGERLGRYAQK